jgi:HPt (histidine-containing phosphotransfer) domain-containing protein
MLACNPCRRLDVDLILLADRLGLNVDEFTDLVKLFLQTARDEIRTLDGAVRDRHGDIAAAVAHSLKGSSGNLGFEGFSRIARQAESNATQEDFEALDRCRKDLLQELDKVNALLS